jgi:DNA-binding beta-propeller fold protein YncE
MTGKQVLILAFLSVVVAAGFSACSHDEPETPAVNDGNYPPAVAEILVKKCATAGCHNTASKDAAAGLDLSTWDKMFEGTRSGATVIPFRADQSTLFFFINTDTTLGVTQLPTMPFDLPPLTNAEVITIRDWINNGAPDKNGFVKFSDNPNRRKMYITNQGCDLVGVHDPASRLAMRYIDVGNSAAIEMPHMVRVSPDGQYWYVIGLGGNFIQKFRASDDVKIGEAIIGTGNWNTFAISPDGTKGWVIDLSNTGRIAYVDLSAMTFVKYYQDPSFFNSPHGSFMGPTGQYLYVTEQLGNTVTKWDVSDPMFPSYEEVTIYSGFPAANPHEIYFHPDGSKYFVTCDQIDEVRVIDAATDTLMAVIPTMDYPLEMSASATNGYLFVTCMAGGGVTVIDINNLTFVKNIATGFDPHGLVVDDEENVVYVANRNLPLSGGPPPHHTSSCGGRNGYMTVIDMSTLELEPGFKFELSVDPYSVMLRN